MIVILLKFTKTTFNANKCIIVIEKLSCRILFCMTKFRPNHDTCLNNVTYKIKLTHNTKIVKQTGTIIC